LAIPLDLVLHADVYGRPRFRLRLDWLFGLISKEVTAPAKKPEEKKVKAKAGLKEGLSRARAMIKILKTKGLLTRVKCLLKDVLSRLEIRDLGADFSIGLDDPADTGLLFAVVGPITVLLDSFFPNRLKVQPSFTGEVSFEGYLDGTVRIRPVKFVVPLARFVFSLAVVRVVTGLVSTKWKRRK
jgi:hypothetical protein